MNLQFYLEKLKSSEEFQAFKKENPASFLCSAFFAIDKNGKDNKQHFDFFVPVKNMGADTQFIGSQSHSADCSLQKNSLNKNIPLPDKSAKRFGITGREANINNRVHRGQIFSFQIENNCKKTELENYSNKTPAQISDNANFDFAEIEKIIQEKINSENVKNKIQKILLSLQNFEKIDYLIGTIFISGMGMIKIKINLNEMKIEDFEKKSFFDMFKVLKRK